MPIIEIDADLFAIPPGRQFVHCVSADCALSAGIAKVFRSRYPQMVAELRASHPRVGQAIPHESPDGRVTWNLFTKQAYWHKPTYETLEAALTDLRRRLGERGVTQLAMPRIASGLDRLDWVKVRTLIERVFGGSGVDIIVCVPSNL